MQTQTLETVHVWSIQYGNFTVEVTAVAGDTHCIYTHVHSSDAFQLVHCI